MGNKITFSKEVAESDIQAAKDNKKLRKVIQEKDSYTELLEKQIQELQTSSNYKTNQKLNKLNNTLSNDPTNMVGRINQDRVKIDTLSETLKANNQKIQILHEIIENKELEIELLANIIPDDKLRALNLEKYIKNDFSHNRGFELEL